MEDDTARQIMQEMEATAERHRLIVAIFAVRSFSGRTSLEGSPSASWNRWMIPIPTTLNTLSRSTTSLER